MKPPEMKSDLPRDGLLATGDDLLTIFTLAKMSDKSRAMRLFSGLSENAKEYVRKNIEYFSILL